MLLLQPSARHDAHKHQRGRRPSHHALTPSDCPPRQNIVAFATPRTTTLPAPGGVGVAVASAADATAAAQHHRHRGDFRQQSPTTYDTSLPRRSLPRSHHHHATVPATSHLEAASVLHSVQPAGNLLIRRPDAKFGKSSTYHSTIRTADPTGSRSASSIRKSDYRSLRGLPHHVLRT